MCRGPNDSRHKVEITSLSLSLSLSLYLSISISRSLSIYLSISLNLSIYLSIYLDLSLYLSLSISRSIYLSIYLDLYIPTCIFFLPLVNMSTTRNNSKTCGDNVSLLTDTVHSLEVSQEFHFKKLDCFIDKVSAILTFFLFLIKTLWYIVKIEKKPYNFRWKRRISRRQLNLIQLTSTTIFPWRLVMRQSCFVPIMMAY